MFASSEIISVQFPLVLAPLNALSGVSGLNEPVNGGEPEEIASAAESLNIVPIKLSPLNLN